MLQLQNINWVGFYLYKNDKIVLILLSDNSLFGVIDIDSPLLSRFDEEDRIGLERAAEIISAAVEQL